MDTYELFPSRGRLVFGTVLGLALLYSAYRLWEVVTALSDAPSLAWAWPALCLVIGGVLAVRSARSLIRPRPCFMGDGKGFSVMGKAKRPWVEFETAAVRKLSVSLVPTPRWVTVKLRKGERRGAKALDIPWTHLPSSAEETAYAIEQLAELARKHKPTPPPTYDPYDPGALRHARSRAA